MTLKEKIQGNLQEALKAKEELKTSVLRLLLSSIATKETEKRTKIWKQKSELKTEQLESESRLAQEEVIDVISSEIKKRRESIELFTKGGRQNLADKEKGELAVLQGYLPEQMPEEELKKIVKEAIAKTGAKEQKDMGKVMAELVPKIKGKADNSLVSKIVKESLVSK